MSEMRFDRAMSAAEGLMWRLEKDPYLSSTFGTVLVLDRVPDVDILRRRMEIATRAVPRLRQRVRSGPSNLAPPVWVDDSDFDIDRHVRRIACPDPGGLRELLDLAAVLVADPLDRTRPLWQFIVVEGLEGGRAALVQKMHHALTDGERGVELSLQYLDFERVVPLPAQREATDSDDGFNGDPGHGSDGSHQIDDDDRGAGSIPSNGLLDTVADGIQLPLAVARRVRDLLSDPASLPGATAAARTTLSALIGQIATNDRGRSPLWTERSLHRCIQVARAPFAETKRVARELGGTLNTAFLTTAAEAAGDYHRRLGSPVESLRASMAISTRTERSGSNAFSLVPVLVPASDMPIIERFRAIHEITEMTRRSSGGPALDMAAALAAPLPTSVITRLARQQAQTIDFATSNVKGSPLPVFLAGARVDEIYPIGPLAGVAFNLTLMSYHGSLDMALHIDTAAVAEPILLAECLERATRAFARA